MLIKPCESNVKFAKKYAITLIVVMTLPTVVFLVFKSYLSQPSIVVSSESFNRCFYNKTIEQAKRLDLQFEFQADSSLKIFGEQPALAQFQPASFDYNYDNNAKCQLDNVRYHVKHVNPLLAPHIPSNADYVSYAPVANKAVYCHYQTQAATSACTFVTIEDHHLAFYDLTNLEQINLSWIAQSRIKPFNVRSVVERWQNKTNRYFGMYFATYANGRNVPTGDVY